MDLQLPRMTAWAHMFLRQTLRSGDCAVDLTAGKGRDSLLMAELVGHGGRVLSFDIQPQALQATASLFEDHGLTAHIWTKPSPPPENGTWLIDADHARLSDYLDAAPRAVTANLGFLPGGDPTICTKGDSTRQALSASLNCLAVGGRIVLVVYIGHPCGREEQVMLEQLACDLPPRDWHVLRLQVLNRQDAPYLLVLEKRR